ncbi:GlxA family transcriptional regulator [Hymenobacter cellulosivorans]|uniref:DJ-1/PfpI family protein n=1 Tax=Hymenobacter cellulosivorans TaxID=2932249 RepID=A0ABY4FG88_9BACT|nr:DJ-1/PfpI family protein [Hymenobacter cellulosivorans]UOQ55141.1 DJ-1/PfpI family protein [Hymenobacter cellulosivorans]
MPTILFLVPDQCTLLDLAGPVQVFEEARAQGADLQLAYAQYQPTPRSSAGLAFAAVPHFSTAMLEKGDLVVVPGIADGALSSLGNAEDQAFYTWLRRLPERGVAVCAVCSGAFVLGAAGLLQGRTCTTHWQHVGALQQAFPDSRVLADRLFVHDRGVYTSAGIAAGIDLALALLEERFGPLLAYKVSRHLVLYYRRNGVHGQVSVYLDHRNHLHPGVHRAQDYLLDHLAENPTLEVLAEVAHSSPRNLTRLFRQHAGVSINEFSTKIRTEAARTLVATSSLTRQAIAERCGFRNPRQLQRLLARPT